MPSPLIPADALAQSTLHDRRLDAAQASKGASGEAIYRAAHALVRAMGLFGDLLEFGAGTGTLISRVAAQGFVGRLTGADILPRPSGIPDAADWVQTDLNEPLPLPGGSFDAIVSTEVIEHLENPRAVFREFARLLRPGGRLLLSTPNQESIRSLTALVFRGHFVSFLDTSYPAHLTALLHEDLKRLCAETGFAAPHFFYTGHGAVPKCRALCWQDVSCGLLRGRLFSDNVLLATTKVSVRHSLPD